MVVKTPEQLAREKGFYNEEKKGPSSDPSTSSRGSAVKAAEPGPEKATVSVPATAPAPGATLEPKPQPKKATASSSQFAFMPTSVIRKMKKGDKVKQTPSQAPKKEAKPPIQRQAAPPSQAPPVAGPAHYAPYGTAVSGGYRGHPGAPLYMPPAGAEHSAAYGGPLGGYHYPFPQVIQASVGSAIGYCFHGG